jgi:hypothetical protein
MAPKDRKLPDRFYRFGCRWCNASFVLTEERDDHESTRHSRNVLPTTTRERLARVAKLVQETNQ